MGILYIIIIFRKFKGNISSSLLCNVKLIKNICHIEFDKQINIERKLSTCILYFKQNEETIDLLKMYTLPNNFEYHILIDFKLSASFSLHETKIQNSFKFSVQYRIIETFLVNLQ